MNGKGKMVYKNGEIYEGEMKDDLKHGRGIFRMANGSVIYGEWEKGKMINLDMGNLTNIWKLYMYKINFILDFYLWFSFEK